MKIKEEFKKGMLKNRNRSILITTTIVISIFIILGFVMTSKVNSWNNKIYPGVKVQGIELGGMLEEEATIFLHNVVNEEVKSKNLKVNVEGKEFQLSYDEISPTIDIKQTISEAISFGKDKNVFQKYFLIAKDSEHNIDLQLDYNEEKLDEFEKAIIKETEKPFVNAAIQVTDGNITIVPETAGIKIEQSKLHDEIIKALNININHSQDVNFVPEIIQAEILAKDLEKIDAVVASFKGPYTYGDDGRNINMELATDYINGTLLMPGEEFSYNKVVGETTPERGFKEANTYVGTEVVPGYGGGICQISTYLYRAVMRANLRPTLRYNHIMMVGYSEASLDATVYEGDIDYRFKNTYDFPIYIQGTMADGEIVFNICGNKEGFGNKTYDLANEILETYDFKTVYEDDPTKEVGYEKIKINGAKGYKSNGYLVTYENGVEINRELVSTDVYEPMNTIKIRGTKKKPVVKPENKPATGTDKPIVDKPSTDKPSTDKPSTDKPSTDKPSTDKPSTDKPSTDKPNTDGDKPSTSNNQSNN